MRERGGSEGVFVKTRQAVDHGALQVGVAFDAQIKPALARVQAALLGHALVRGIGVALALTQAGTAPGYAVDGHAQGRAGAGLASGVGAGVNQV